MLLIVDVFIGDVIPLLEALKEFETESVTEDYFEDYDYADNTYNWNANISNDLDFRTKDHYALVKVHLYGDIRGGYSDCFVIDMENDDNFVGFCYDCLDMYTIETKPINDRYVADIELFSEGYNVYDYDTQEDVGTYYELELDDLRQVLLKDGVIID